MSTTTPVPTPSKPSFSGPRKRFSLGLAFIGSVLAFLFLFRPVILGLIGDWTTDENASHGPLIPLLSLWLVWQGRAELRPRVAPGHLWGAAIMITAMGLYLIFFVGGIEVGQRLAFVLAVLGIVLYNAGAAVFQLLLFPLFFLFFMIPLPVTVRDQFTFPLQLLVTEAASAVLRQAHIPVAHAGNLIALPTGTLEVADACSGIHSLIGLFTVAFFFAYEQRLGRWRAAALVLSAVPIALITNILRVAVSGFLGAVYGIKMAQGFLHDFSGFGFMAAGIAFLFLEMRLLKKEPGAEVIRR